MNMDPELKKKTRFYIETYCQLERLKNPKTRAVFASKIPYSEIVTFFLQNRDEIQQFCMCRKTFAYQKQVIQKVLYSQTHPDLIPNGKQVAKYLAWLVIEQVALSE